MEVLRSLHTVVELWWWATKIEKGGEERESEGKVGKCWGEVEWWSLSNIWWWWRCVVEDDNGGKRKEERRERERICHGEGRREKGEEFEKLRRVNLPKIETCQLKKKLPKKEYVFINLEWMKYIAMFSIAALAMKNIL